MRGVVPRTLADGTISYRAQFGRTKATSFNRVCKTPGLARLFFDAAAVYSTSVNNRWVVVMIEEQVLFPSCSFLLA